MEGAIAIAEGRDLFIFIVDIDANSRDRHLVCGAFIKSKYGHRNVHHFFLGFRSFVTCFRRDGPSAWPFAVIAVPDARLKERGRKNGV